MIHCNKCDFTCNSMRHLNIHLKNHTDFYDTDHSALELSDIQQVGRSSHGPTIISTGISAQSPGNQDIQYLYKLNPVNQARKLIENTSRPEFSIRYSNPQTILGVQHPTSVSVDCNSGVYLTAIKPALQAINVGW